MKLIWKVDKWHFKPLRSEPFSPISKKSCHSLVGLSYGANSTCVEKPWPWRVEWWVKLYFWTLWGRYGHFWSRRSHQNLRSQQFDLRSKNSIWPNFQKKVLTDSRVCRTILIRRALESPDPGASNGGSNFNFQHFGADMGTFEVAGVPRISDLSNSSWDLRFWCTLAPF